MNANERKIHFPFFQIKANGHVVEHTNSEDSANKVMREVGKPAEMWLINVGSAKLLRKV